MKIAFKAGIRFKRKEKKKTELASETIKALEWSARAIKKKGLVGAAITSRKKRCGRFLRLLSQKEGQRRGGNKERRAKSRRDQKSRSLGWAWEKETMWVSVCGSAGRLTSGLHYKRKAPWGSDPSSAYKGAVVVQARNKLYKTSGEHTQRELKNKTASDCLCAHCSL